MANADEDGLSESAKNYLLAMDYQAGRHGKPKDLTQAAAYMIKAAESGHCLAAYNVAAMYFHGQGVSQDFERAREWALRLSAMGSPEYVEKILTAIGEKKNEIDSTNEVLLQNNKRDSNNIKRNLFAFAKSVVQTILGICLLASVGYCSGGYHAGEGNDPGELPDQYRKP